jgi:hypothetical protein
MQDPRNDDKYSQHFFTRARGQLKKGPIQRDGYVNNTKQTTKQEEFSCDSVDAHEYMFRPRIYATTKDMIAMRKLKTVSQDDDF